MSGFPLVLCGKEDRHFPWSPVLCSLGQRQENMDGYRKWVQLVKRYSRGSQWSKDPKHFECKAMGPGIDHPFPPPPRIFQDILLQPSLLVERGSSSGFSKAPWKVYNFLFGFLSPPPDYKHYGKKEPCLLLPSSPQAPLDISLVL